MTMSISIVPLDPTGSLGMPQLVEGPEGLAGIEAMRNEVWGSDVVAMIGSEFLCRLAQEDLLVVYIDLPRFVQECERLLGVLERISTETGWTQQYLERCIRNMAAAASSAQRCGGALLID